MNHKRYEPKMYSNQEKSFDKGRRSRYFSNRIVKCTQISNILIKLLPTYQLIDIVTFAIHHTIINLHYHTTLFPNE